MPQKGGNFEDFVVVKLGLHIKSDIKKQHILCYKKI